MNFFGRREPPQQNPQDPQTLYESRVTDPHAKDSDIDEVFAQAFMEALSRSRNKYNRMCEMHHVLYVQARMMDIAHDIGGEYMENLLVELKGNPHYQGKGEKNASTTY